MKRQTKRKMCLCFPKKKMAAFHSATGIQQSSRVLLIIPALFPSMTSDNICGDQMRPVGEVSFANMVFKLQEQEEDEKKIDANTKQHTTQIRPLSKCLWYVHIILDERKRNLK